MKELGRKIKKINAQRTHRDFQRTRHENRRTWHEIGRTQYEIEQTRHETGRTQPHNWKIFPAKLMDLSQQNLRGPMCIPDSAGSPPPPLSNTGQSAYNRVFCPVFLIYWACYLPFFLDFWKAPRTPKFRALCRFSLHNIAYRKLKLKYHKSHNRKALHRFGLIFGDLRTFSYFLVGIYLVGINRLTISRIMADPAKIANPLIEYFGPSFPTLCIFSQCRSKYRKIGISKKTLDDVATYVVRYNRVNVH